MQLETSAIVMAFSEYLFFAISPAKECKYTPRAAASIVSLHCFEAARPAIKHQQQNREYAANERCVGSISP